MTDQPTSYHVEVRAGPLFGEEELRSIDVPLDDVQAELHVIELFESYRDYYASRNNVTWEGYEMRPDGTLAGLAPDGVSYRIVITPPLPVDTDPPTQPTLW
jgi:hypothetical protein